MKIKKHVLTGIIPLLSWVALTNIPAVGLAQDEAAGDLDVLPANPEELEDSSPAVESLPDLKDQMEAVQKDTEDQQAADFDETADLDSAAQGDVSPQGADDFGGPDDEGLMVEGMEDTKAPENAEAPDEGVKSPAESTGEDDTSAQTFGQTTPQTPEGTTDGFDFGNAAPSQDSAPSFDFGNEAAPPAADSFSFDAPEAGSPDGGFKGGDTEGTTFGGTFGGEENAVSFAMVSSGKAQPAQNKPQRPTNALLAVIQFSTGSTGLSERDRIILDQVRQIQQRFNADITVVGHSSAFTRDMSLEDHNKVNRTIAAARADSVVRYLSGRGIGQDHLFIDSKADGDPLYEEFMPSGEAGNRRVEVFLAY